MFAERFYETEHARILGRDTIGDGRGDADDLLEHLDKGVVFVLARFDLAGFHAEGGGEVEALESAVGLVMFSDINGLGQEGERDKAEGFGRSNTCMEWWRCAG